MATTNKSIRLKFLGVNAVTPATSSIGKSLNKLQWKATALNKSLGLQGVGKGIAGVGSAVRGLGLTSGIAVAAIGYGTKRMIDSMTTQADKISKLSQRIGIDSTSLQAYGFAADLNGVKQDVFNKGLEKFSKNLGEAKVGTGALTTFLNKYDKNLLESFKNTESLEDGMNVLAEAIANETDETKQAALANAAFGRSGAQALILLRKGSKGLTEAKKKFIELGGGASKDFMKVAARYQDAITRISAVWDVAKFKILGPLIEFITLKLETFVNKIMLLAKNGDLLPMLRSWGRSVLDFGKKLYETGKSIYAFMKGVGELVDKIGGWKTVMIAAIVAVTAKLAASIISLGIQLAALGTALLFNPITWIIIAIAALAAGVVYLCSEFETARHILHGFGKIAKGIIETIAATILIVPKAILQILGFIPSSWMPDGWADEIKEASKYLDNLANFTDGFKSITDSGKDFKKGWATMTTDATFEGDEGDEGNAGDLGSAEYGVNELVRTAVTGGVGVNTLARLRFGTPKKQDDPQKSKTARNGEIGVDELVARRFGNPISRPESQKQEYEVLANSFAAIKIPNEVQKAEVELTVKSEPGTQTTVTKVSGAANTRVINTGNILANM